MIVKKRNDLARMLANIKSGISGGEQKIRYYIDEYIGDPINGIPSNRRDKSSARGNIVKELNRDNITWLVFIRAMRVFQITNFKITIEFDSKTPGAPPGTKDVYETVVDLGGNYVTEDNEDLLDAINEDYANNVTKSITIESIKRHKENGDRRQHPEQQV